MGMIVRLWGSDYEVVEASILDDGYPGFVGFTIRDGGRDRFIRRAAGTAIYLPVQP